MFAYRIQIHNDGDVGVQLISRSWYITDANNHVREVHGEGWWASSRVCNRAKPTNTSAARCWPPPRAPCGGYNFTADDGREFEAPVPEFFLNGAQALH